MRGGRTVDVVRVALGVALLTAGCSEGSPPESAPPEGVVRGTDEPPEQCIPDGSACSAC